MRELCKTKQQGDLAEMAFSRQATEKGLGVAKPFGDNARYDVIVDNGRERWRVQVKSTSQLCRKNVYQVRAARQEHLGNRRAAKTVAYLKSEIDFLAVYVAPEESWYILPWSALRGRTCLSLHAAEHKKRGPCAEYLEAWHLLRG